MTSLRKLWAALPCVLALMLGVGQSHAQQANVVSACGAVTYQANGLPMPPTQTTDGRQCVSGTALPAGSNVIGKTSIDQTTPGTTNGVQTLSGSVTTATLVSTGASAAVSLTRTNDTNAYTAGDVIGTATGSTAALTFAMKPGQFMITGASVEVDITAVVSGMTSFNLQLYNVTPPSALGDNAAWDLPSGDRASYLGPVSLGTPVDVGSTLYVYSAQLNQQVLVPVSGNLFAYLTTVGAWTPAASTVFVVTLYGFAL